ncbi:MAG: acyloxyacyl hydrolase [Planctomycetota bacterium]|jgi:hypothetical protein
MPFEPPLPPRSLRAVRTLALVVALASRVSAGDREASMLAPLTTTPAAFDDTIDNGGGGEAPTLFGTKGTRHLRIYAGHGVDLTDSGNDETVVKVGLSNFIADGLALDLELDFVRTHQVGENAVGAGGSLLFRWHALNDVNWSLYLDGGLGILYSTNPVPQGGTQFNFTPQLGGGVEFELTPRLRGIFGARWHHISNANTSSNNPGRDHLLIYGGLSVPF